MKTKFLSKSDISTETKTKIENKEQAIEEFNLVLYNDDVHTFDFVIETLIDVCGHDYLQAVQCTHIVHHNGKCAVKRGIYNVLKPKCEALLERELSAEIQGEF